MTKMQARVLFWQYQSRLIAYSLTRRGFDVAPFAVWRTEQEQARLVAERKSQTMYSRHRDWLAVDLAPCDGADFQWPHRVGDVLWQLGEFWESMNPNLLRWGGRWVRGVGGRWTTATWEDLRSGAVGPGIDPYHFEMTRAYEQMNFSDAQYALRTKGEAA